MAFVGRPMLETRHFFQRQKVIPSGDSAAVAASPLGGALLGWCGMTRGGHGDHEAGIIIRLVQ